MSLSEMSINVCNRGYCIRVFVGIVTMVRGSWHSSTHTRLGGTHSTSVTTTKGDSGLPLAIIYLQPIETGIVEMSDCKL